MCVPLHKSDHHFMISVIPPSLRCPRRQWRLELGSAAVGLQASVPQPLTNKMRVNQGKFRGGGNKGVWRPGSTTPCLGCSSTWRWKTFMKSGLLPWQTLEEKHVESGGYGTGQAARSPISRGNVYKTNSLAFSPQANYTDWATATCSRNLVPTFADRGVSRGRRGGSTTVVNLSFLNRSRYFSFK
jgi:hypothetical protein